jgi:hypothetical protein
VSDQDRKLQKIAEKFQADMNKAGLGVSIHVNDEPPLVVTSACEKCGGMKDKIPTETVEDRGPGWKCSCGWWNWL